LFFVLLLNTLSVRAQQATTPSSSGHSADSDTSNEVAHSKIPSIGSPYVELDSWIYPAIERLAALGYIHAEFLGMRPWTRIECARLVQEADDKLNSDRSFGEARQLPTELEKEFGAELDTLAEGTHSPTIRLESVYENLMGISGTPLNDSYHFGQTLTNNYGRPYQEGFNTFDGLSGFATAGRFAIYVRGEYQHAPTAAGYSLPIRQFIATADNNPLQPLTPIPATNQFRLLDTYVAANLADWNLAFGKQSLWWGPGEGGPLLFSDNAEPIYMFRASRIAPFRLPWIFRWLGPMKLDLFYGKLSGNHFPSRPMIHGEKISFKPTQNLEFGFSRTGELGGVGQPLTIGRIWLSYTSLTSPAIKTAADNPGKRTGGFDFSYRVPFVRDWLTFYNDSLSDDDPSPLARPSRAGISPGIYMPKIPGLLKLDLRVEAVSTDAPNSGGGQYIYFDTVYHDLYTNKNKIIGNWIGRDGQGIQSWSTYWFSPRNSLKFGYRHAKVASAFIPGGETFNDGSARLTWCIRAGLSVSTFLQYEKWLAPILAVQPQTNWTSSVELTFWPHF